MSSEAHIFKRSEREVYSSSKKCRAAASDVVPKFVSPSDPAAWWTGPHKGPALLAYSDSYLIDVFGVIVDVDAFRSIRQAEVGAAKTMIQSQRFKSAIFVQIQNACVSI